MRRLLTPLTLFVSILCATPLAEGGTHNIGFEQHF